MLRLMRLMASKPVHRYVQVVGILPQFFFEQSFRIFQIVALICSHSPDEVTGLTGNRGRQQEEKADCEDNMIEFVKYFHRFSEINERLIDLRETKNKPDTFPTNRKSSSGYKIYIFL